MPYNLQLILFAAERMVERDSELAELTNVDFCLVARNVELALAQQQTQAALGWVRHHKSKLKKCSSTLEFHLHLQEFIELIRADRRMDAIQYARKYVTSMEGVPFGEVQHAAVLLAFQPDTSNI